MKKIITRSLLVLLVLVVLAALGVHFFLDSLVRREIQTIGPELAKVSVKVDSVNIVLLSGSGKVKGLVIGNPEGYKSPSAVSVGEASMALRPGSLLSDKVVIENFELHAPEITFETDFLHNNLSKIRSNLEETSGGGTNQAPANPPATTETKAGKKLEVDNFLITGGKVHVAVSTLGQSRNVPLPDIHLTDLGKDPEGITAAELARKVFGAIEAKAAEAATSALADLKKGGVFLSNQAGPAATNTVDKVTKGIGDLFKKK